MRTDCASWCILGTPSFHLLEQGSHSNFTFNFPGYPGFSKLFRIRKSTTGANNIPCFPFDLVCARETLFQKREPTGYPLKLHFQSPCVFSVISKKFPVPIYVNCDCYIHKTDLANLSSFKKTWKSLQQISK